MQKFNFHCHTSFENIFDGQNNIEEMISSYELKGFLEVGISNHCIYNKSFANLPQNNQMNFSNINKIIDVFKRFYEKIDECTSNHKIKIYKGMEVDFFQSVEWRKSFETILKELKPDYVIGATHFLRNKKEDFLCDLYFLNTLPKPSKEEMDELLENYWNNVIESIKSGYFKFIVHPDYCRQYNLCMSEKWNEYKYKVVETMYYSKTPCEINTKSIRKCGFPSPDWWLIKEMIKKEIPLLISDDAHRIEDTGALFDVVEEKLQELNCEKRFLSL